MKFIGEPYYEVNVDESSAAATGESSCEPLNFEAETSNAVVDESGASSSGISSDLATCSKTTGFIYKAGKLGKSDVLNLLCMHYAL